VKRHERQKTQGKRRRGNKWKEKEKSGGLEGTFQGIAPTVRRAEGEVPEGGQNTSTRFSGGGGERGTQDKTLTKTRKKKRIGDERGGDDIKQT